MHKFTAAALVAMMAFGLVACGESDTSGASGSEATSGNAQESQMAETPSTEEAGDDTEEANEETVLIDDDVIKITFKSLGENALVEGYAVISLSYENYTDKEITVYPKNAYVNDTQITMTSGVPTTMAAGKKSQNPIGFYYATVGLESIDEVESVELSFWIVDEDFNTVEETESVSLPL